MINFVGHKTKRQISMIFALYKRYKSNKRSEFTCEDIVSSVKMTTKEAGGAFMALCHESRIGKTATMLPSLINPNGQTDKKRIQKWMLNLDFDWETLQKALKYFSPT